uniref:Uncharacterized protein LOC111123501 isoform X3 n=1 Tax=Crassostrea virginica TaxID=6565 RepID=A0A8B8D1F2_CRAVI|nr:uncharacterized protein LOC111123501 isoform X3 [Crassostrea virginica]
MGGSFSHSTVCVNSWKPCDSAAHQQYIDEILKNDEDEDTSDDSQSDSEDTDSLDAKIDFEDKEKDEKTEDEFSSINVQEFDGLFPFENLVFAGGGAKGVAYPGALQVLEEVGVLKKIKRFAGTSVGSITALMVALGYTSQDTREVARMDLTKYFDASCGKLSLLYNLLKYLGWHPMNTFYDFIGDIVEKKLGCKDATFLDLYKRTGKELCVVVTNLTNMEEEYFHPKTTPDIALRLAIRISISIPGLMQPVKIRRNGMESIYADGAVLVNYPISCFDGWWLSMKKEDSFFKRLQPVEMLPTILDRKNKFARDEETANKTLGFVLPDDYGIHRYHCLLTKSGNTRVIYPNTPLARKALRKKKKVRKLGQEHEGLKSTLNKFLQMTSKYNEDSEECISREELTQIFDDENFSSLEKERLFGKNASVENVMNLLDSDGNGKISFKEIVEYCEEMGFAIASRGSGLNRLHVDSFSDYIGSVFNTMYVNVDQLGFSVEDLPRTIGLNTHYVSTTNFKMEPADTEFLERESYTSTMAFLKRFAATHLASSVNL